MQKDNLIRQFLEYQRPALVKLTQVGIAGLDGGAPTVAYVDPTNIAMIVRAIGGRSNEGDQTFEQEPVTCIRIYGGHHMLVTETPEIVALRRERALNNTVAPAAVGDE